jgi:hypothetical protein
MGRGNPNPKHKYTSPYSEPMSDRTIGVRLPLRLDAQVRSLPNRTEWLRRVIEEALEREQHLAPASNTVVETRLLKD